METKSLCGALALSVPKTSTESSSRVEARKSELSKK
jgi:hypothetical protein